MKLFSPIKIRDMELQNRIVMAPMLTNLGYKSRRGRAYFAARAKGGVGAIVAYGIPPELLTRDEAWGSNRKRELFIDGIKLLTDEIHGLDTKIGVQLWYGNRFPAVLGGDFNRGEWIAPSPRREGSLQHMLVTPNAYLREITVQEIRSLVKLFGSAAFEAKDAGFDFVEFHGAHSYLANQFFSPADNHRTDNYGGDFSGRKNFGVECIRAMREAVGDKYPIFFRFPAVEERPGGISLVESKEYAVELENAGVDVLNVSIGTSTDRRGTEYFITPPYDQPPCTYAHLAEAVKGGVTVHVAAVGRIKTPLLAETILQENKADLVSIGRPLIADPEWPRKASRGEIDAIRPCIGCCECAVLATTGNEVRCAVNPLAGRELEYHVLPPAARKKVVVIGGGLAGMETAATAAARGHKTVLFEKNEKLGGQLLYSAASPYKEEHAHLIKYHMRRLEKSGVEVRLACEADLGRIRKENPDAVVIAAGAIPLLPSIPGITQENVCIALDVFLGRTELGGKVVVIGGGMIGLEAAELISVMGREVTIIEMLEEVGKDTISLLARAAVERLQRAGVMIETETEAVEITPRGVTGRKGNEVSIFEADSIVVACGMRSQNEMLDGITRLNKDLHVVGDCATPRRIRYAIEEGFLAGCTL
jgi:2,4-dienoyl-CoA reductase-like NADH-dependent reductase (Old Yellow Enzyme family)/thioredoxin reductase